MKIQIELDTSQPSEVAQLAALAAALGGPAKPVAPTTKTEPKPEKPATSSALPGAAAKPEGKAYTIADIRVMLGTKQKEGAKAALQKVVESGKLADVPAEKFNELVELLKSVPAA